MYAPTTKARGARRPLLGQYRLPFQVTVRELAWSVRLAQQRRQSALTLNSGKAGPTSGRKVPMRPSDSPPSAVLVLCHVWRACVHVAMAFVLVLLSIGRASAQTDSWATMAPDPNAKWGPAVVEINGKDRKSVV